MSTCFENSTRRISFRYDILQGEIKIGEDKVLSGHISYNSDNLIKRTASFELLPAGIDFIRNQLRVVAIIDGKEHVLGTFILSSPSIKHRPTGKTCTVEAYDRTLILKEDCFTEMKCFPKNTRYDTVISDILLSAGIEAIIQPIPITLPAAREYEIGTSKLDAINELLDEINYNPIIADENGSFVVSKYSRPGFASVRHEYIADEFSVISSDYESEADCFAIPNVFIACCDNPEMSETYFSVFENTDPASKLSTTYRGRRIVSEIYNPSFVDSQAALDEYVRRKAYEESSVFDKLSINTAIMPDHGYRDVIHISNDTYDDYFLEKSWEMDLAAGGYMNHTLVGVQAYV